MHEWLMAAGCTHGVLESTGVYWKPVWHRLEDSLTLVLANATALRNLPGRMSDVRDARWLADLLAHGLVRGTLVPSPSIQSLRAASVNSGAPLADRNRHASRAGGDGPQSTDRGGAAERRREARHRPPPAARRQWPGDRSSLGEEGSPMECYVGLDVHNKASV